MISLCNVTIQPKLHHPYKFSLIRFNNLIDDLKKLTQLTQLTEPLTDRLKARHQMRPYDPLLSQYGPRDNTA